MKAASQDTASFAGIAFGTTGKTILENIYNKGRIKHARLDKCQKCSAG
jgi:hypothetical protein